MPFAIPMVWREPKDHPSDCYISLTNKTGIASKSKHAVKYPDFPFAVRFVPHSEELPVPKPPENLTFGDKRSDSDEGHGQQEGDKLIAIQHLKQVVPHLTPFINTRRS